MNKDFELKIRLNNILWSLDYYTRIEVKLAEYSITKKIPMELTDLDVLGIRLSPDFLFDYIVVDCTSNKDFIKSPMKKIFWLKGVMDFFGASKGYLVLNTNSPIAEFQRGVATKLGITILNLENLSNLEKRILKPEIKTFKLANPESWIYFENNLTTLDEALHPLLKFRKHTYWMNEHHQNISVILTMLQKYKTSMKEDHKFHRVLIMDLMTLLSISLLHMSKFVFHTNPEKPEQELRAYFYGGYKELEMREEIVKNLNRLIERIQRQKALFDHSSEISLDPEYLPQLFDLVFRWVNKPKDAIQIPRYLQMLLFEEVLYDRKNSDAFEYLKRNFSETTEKFVRDLGAFLININGIPKNLLIPLFKE